MSDAPVVTPMIFISYRRDDSSGHVGRLYDALSAHFGRHRIFFDIDHIAPGQDFVQVLEDSLTHSSVMIVVMGKRWAGTGKIGARRLDDSNDFVRLEVASGLRRPELRLIPALIVGAKMPSPAALPDDLKDLSRRNAIELSDTRWREDVERLIASLERDMAITAPKKAPLELAQKMREVTVPPAILDAAKSKWGLIGGAALVAVLVIWFAVSRSHATVRSTDFAGSIATHASAATTAAVPADDPQAIPSHLDEAAKSALAAGKKWRADAVLTQIVAAQDSSGGSVYHVQFGFRSPTDGAGLGVSSAGAGDASSERLAAVPMSTIRALPDSFIDLPAAVATARKSGMFGALREGRLATITSRGVVHPAWRLRSASESSHMYYVDALTGAPLAAPPSPPHVNIVGKVKGLFH